MIDQLHYSTEAKDTIESKFGWGVPFYELVLGTVSPSNKNLGISCWLSSSLLGHVASWWWHQYWQQSNFYFEGYYSMDHYMIYTTGYEE